MNPGRASTLKGWQKIDLLRPLWHSRPECQAHARKLIAIIDERDAAKKRIWTALTRLDRQWGKLNDKNWRLFKKISRTKANTIPGIAAQAKVFLVDNAFEHSICEVAIGLANNIAGNLQRLVAAQ